MYMRDPVKFWAFFILLAAVAVTVLLYSLRERSLTIHAGPVVAQTGKYKLQGSFTIEEVPFYAKPFLGPGDWLESHGHAGACLQADASTLDPELTEANCVSGKTDSRPTGWPPNLKAVFHDSKCWISDPAEYCVKSRDDNNRRPFANGTYRVRLQEVIDAKAAYDEMQMRGAQGNFSINWRTSACLNPVDPINPVDSKQYRMACIPSEAVGLPKPLRRWSDPVALP